MGILAGHKKRLELQKAHEAEMAKFAEDHRKLMQQLLKDWKEDVNKIDNEKKAIAEMYSRDLENLGRRLEETEGKLKAQLSEKDRMEKLLTKVSKRSATYRTMMEAVAAWEEEIAIEREDDKLENFIKWKNNREDV